MLISKPDKDSMKKENYTPISLTDKEKYPQQNKSKLNPAIYEKNNILQPSEAYPRTSRLAQYAKINHQNNSP